MKKLIATLVLIPLLIAGVVIAQTYNTLHGTVNLTVTAVEPLYFVGPDTWDLTLNPGESDTIMVQIGNNSQADVMVLIYAVAPLGVSIDVVEWVLPAGSSGSMIPMVVRADMTALEGDYILDVVFEPL